MLNKEEQIRILKIVKSTLPLLDDVFTKTDDEFVEDRLTEVMCDLEFVVNAWEGAFPNEVSEDAK